MLSRQSCAFLAAAALSLSGRPASAADEDPWWGPDKALHFGVSAGLAAGGYGASSLVLDQRAARAGVGAGFSLTVGAGKELYDLSGGGDPSWKDFAWDVAGAGVGVAIALLVDLALSPEDPKPRPSTVALRF
jgi:putative lipoprotein